MSMALAGPDHGKLSPRSASLCFYFCVPKAVHALQGLHAYLCSFEYGSLGVQQQGVLLQAVHCCTVLSGEEHCV